MCEYAFFTPAAMIRGNGKTPTLLCKDGGACTFCVTGNSNRYFALQKKEKIKNLAEVMKLWEQ